MEAQARGQLDVSQSSSGLLWLKGKGLQLGWVDSLRIPCYPIGILLAPGNCRNFLHQFPWASIPTFQGILRLRIQQNILHPPSTNSHLVSLLYTRDLGYKNKEKTRSVLSETLSSSRDTYVSQMQWSVKIWQKSKLIYNERRSGEFDLRTFENNFPGGRYLEMVAFQENRVA